jgi:hypothetical protein
MVALVAIDLEYRKQQQQKMKKLNFQNVGVTKS